MSDESIDQRIEEMLADTEAAIIEAYNRAIVDGVGFMVINKDGDLRAVSMAEAEDIIKLVTSADSKTTRN